MGLLSNLAEILRPVDSRYIILGIFDHFYPYQDGIPMGTLGYCWAKITLLKFDVFQTTSETGRLITSKTDVTSLTGLYCTCCTGYDNVIIFMLFSGATLGTWVGVPMVFSSLFGVKKYPWVQYSLVQNFGSCVAQDMSNLGYYAFPHEWNCGKFIIKHHIKLRWDITSFWV